MTPRHSASLVASVGPRDGFPRIGLPEIALAGRSNVGKSSLINCLVGRRGLAPTSCTPGKTRTIRFYAVDGSFALVDLPGYGYAKVARTLREAWKRLVERYFAARPTLVAAVHVVDIRHPGLKNDALLWDWLAMAGVERLVVATKADKVSRGERARLSAAIRDSLRLENDGVVVFSAATGEGKEDLWRWILAKRDSAGVRGLRGSPAPPERDGRTVILRRSARSRARRCHAGTPDARVGDRVE